MKFFAFPDFLDSKQILRKFLDLFSALSLPWKTKALANMETKVAEKMIKG